MPEKRVRFALPPKSALKPTKAPERAPKGNSWAAPIVVATGLSAVAASMDRKDRSKTTKSPARCSQPERRSQPKSPRRSQRPPAPMTPRRSERRSTGRDNYSRVRESASRRNNDRSTDYGWTRTVRRTTRVWY